EAGVPFDEDVAVGRFDEALPAEVALDAAAGDLPYAGDDRRGAGVGDPGLRCLRHRLVQNDVPVQLPGAVAVYLAVGVRHDHPVAPRQKAPQTRAAPQLGALP